MQIRVVFAWTVKIGGDGRADSPGHSAKYGSYGIIYLRTNKVLHIESVQVYYNTNALNKSTNKFQLPI